MGLLVWLLIGLMLVLVGLASILTIALLRLGNELQRLEDSTDSMVVRLRRTMRTVQLAVPVVAVAQKLSHGALEKIKLIFKKGEKHESRR